MSSLEEQLQEKERIHMAKEKQMEEAKAVLLEQVNSLNKNLEEQKKAVEVSCKKKKINRPVRDSNP